MIKVRENYKVERIVVNKFGSLAASKSNVVLLDGDEELFRKPTEMTIIKPPLVLDKDVVNKRHVSVLYAELDVINENDERSKFYIGNLTHHDVYVVLTKESDTVIYMNGNKYYYFPELTVLRIPPALKDYTWRALNSYKVEKMFDIVINGYRYPLYKRKYIGPGILSFLPRIIKYYDNSIALVSLTYLKNAYSGLRLKDEDKTRFVPLGIERCRTLTTITIGSSDKIFKITGHIVEDKSFKFEENKKIIRF